MKVEEGLKYSKEHEWIKVTGDEATVGITDFAQHSLGEIVYIELPGAGDAIKAGDVLSSIDSIKAASDVFSPVSGKIVKVNGDLSGTPEKINSDPYGSWIAVIKMSDAKELDAHMDAKQYEEFCGLEE